jgi:DNA-binding CsgD family transcriptional regulator
MPKQKLGTGNKRAVLQRPGTSYTAPEAIKLRQRRSAALDYRLQGHSYHRIAKAMNCHPSTVHDYVVRAMKDIIPREKAEAVLEMELERLNAMQAAIYSSAVAGDVSKIDCCLRIIHQRARLLGLYPDKPRSGVTMSFGGGADIPNAEDTGINVVFVRPTKWLRDDSERTVNGKSGPVIDHTPNGGKA